MQMSCQTNRGAKLWKLGDDSRTFKRDHFLNHPEWIHVFTARGCRRATLSPDGNVFVANTTYPRHGGSAGSHNFISLRTNAQLPLLWRPTLEQALPHFFRLVAKPGAVGEIQRQAGFWQGVLDLLVVDHERGGAMHVVKDLEGKEHMHVCSSSGSAPKAALCLNAFNLVISS